MREVTGSSPVVSTKKTHPFVVCFFGSFRTYNRTWGWEPFCGNKTLCAETFGYAKDWTQRTTLITSERGAPLKAQVLLSPPKNTAENHSFLQYFLSKSQTWYIITARSVVDIISPLGCISSRISVYSLRLDDIQNFVLMICNFRKIDDIQGIALILMLYCNIIH